MADGDISLRNPVTNGNISLGNEAQTITITDGISSDEIFGASPILSYSLSPSFVGNLLDQKLDILGSVTKDDDKILVDELLGYGAKIAGQLGSAASITVTSVVTVSGLTGMSVASVGRFLYLFNTAGVDNNGAFLIATYISPTTVTIENDLATTDANNGSISWIERDPYVLEDDLNFARTDRKAIKGTDNYYDTIPTYNRPSATTTDISANLTNIAGKTTDAKAMVFSRIYRNYIVSSGDGYATISDETETGILKHATSLDRTGIPIFDGEDAGNHYGCFVRVLNAFTGDILKVQDGYADNDGYSGQLIYGRTRAGSSTSPNSVEIEFRSVAWEDDLDSSVSYTWQDNQVSVITLIYPYRERIDLADENSVIKDKIFTESGLKNFNSNPVLITNYSSVGNIFSNDVDYVPLRNNQNDTIDFRFIANSITNIEIKIIYAMSTAEVNSVNLRLDILILGAGDNPSTPFTIGTDFIVSPGNDTNIHTINSYNSSDLLISTNLNDIVYCKLTRLGSSDSHAGDFRILEIRTE